MAQNVVINEVVYSNVPYILIPKSGTTGNAKFTDTSDATLDNGNKMLNGVTAYGADGTKYTGSIASKTATTYTPILSFIRHDEVTPAGRSFRGFSFAIFSNPLYRRCYSPRELTAPGRFFII